MPKAPAATVDKTCENCQKPFVVLAKSNNPGRFCSRQCFYASGKAGRPRLDVVKTCAQCGTDFSSAPWRAKSKTYCSNECRLTHLKSGEMKQCAVCGKDFYVKQSASFVRACGRTCGAVLISRAKSGITRSPREDRKCPGCDTIFQAIVGDETHKFCTYNCAKSHRARGIETRKTNCRWCQKEFEYRYSPQNPATWKQFCSAACSSRSTFHDLKTRRRCDDGHAVNSESERTVDNWLASHRVFHSYEVDGPGGLCDWKVGDIYIEFWGMVGNAEYDANKARKLEAYRAAGAKLIELHPADLDNLDVALAQLLPTP